MKIYLIGYMYSGKTTVGHALARSMGYQFYDLDQAFEAKYHTSIPLFFQRYGEEAFRRLEQQMLHTTADLDNVVISTGGGTPCFFDNIQWINSHGVSVYLDVTLETILCRAAKSRKTRPILADKNPEEREAYVRQQLQQRLPYYQQAQINFPADNPDMNMLKNLLNEK